MTANPILTDTRCAEAQCHSTHTDVAVLVRPDYLVEQVPTVDEKRARVPLCRNHADEWEEKYDAGKMTIELQFE